MTQREHLLTCLGEEILEVAIEAAKCVSKSNRFGLDDRNVLNPTGPTNRERLVDELNDLLGVATLLAEYRIIPVDWMDASKQIAKRKKVLKFLEYARGVGALKEDEL